MVGVVTWLLSPQPETMTASSHIAETTGSTWGRATALLGAEAPTRDTGIARFIANTPFRGAIVANGVPTRYSGDVSATEPLFRAEGLRIDDHGPVLENLTLATTGGNVAFVGAPRALFEAAAGMRDVTAGSLRVGGMDPRRAARQGALASAPADVAVPPRWTVLELALENARLAGHGRRDRQRLAIAAVNAMQLGERASTRLGGLELALRRAAILAAALATDAPELIVEDFTTGLADGAARALARTFVTAAKGRRWALFAGQLALSSPLGLEAEEAVLFAGGRFACAGLPADIATRERTFAVRTASADAAGTPDAPLAFADKLRARGAAVDADETGRALTVTIPDGFSTLELVTLARAEGVVVMELQPLSGAVA